MKSPVRLSLAVCAFVLLCQFSSQDSTTKGGIKPAVNFYGSVTDLRETFKAENITIDRLYKAIPVYQQPPAEGAALNSKKNRTESAQNEKKEDKKNDESLKKNQPAEPRPYDPTDNITRLDLSEIAEIKVSPNQNSQRFGNRDYIVVDVYSKDKKRTKNSYIIEADKKLFFDQVNDAGPIEKEIKLRSVISVALDGYKQQDEPAAESKKTTAPIKAAHGQPSRTKRLISYVKNAFSLQMTL